MGQRVRKARSDSCFAAPPAVVFEALAVDGLLMLAGTGNQTALTCAVTQTAAPSVLPVGGVVIPPDGARLGYRKARKAASHAYPTE